MRIDAHQHFWQYDPRRHNWITSEMKVLQQDFIPLDLQFILEKNDFDGCIAVQADQSDEETKYLVQLAQEYSFVKGVVGWVDLRASNIDEQLHQYRDEAILKGFRHIVEGEEDPDFLQRDSFLKGIESLTKYRYTYDLLIRPRHYAGAITCVQSNPNQTFILDHIAKPPIKSREFEEWALFIEELAAFSNVSCKVSGLATEADWKSWRLDDFTQYLGHVFDSFGKDRIMFGSDWPVCLLAASYEESVTIVESKLDAFTTAEKEAFWGLNALKTYNL
ncbi:MULTISPECIES: amidohydrolase family protein [Sphingobacterium]|jgi:L-fuconolactonase|uniref:amidohydrolase family protein n=1 Tax=Sphingobacterium TaxID=28453 RepID=UPI001053CC6F|nr:MULTISPECIES: amidohydrolase family protein [Sphingobacterium]MCW2263896.1 L-fuconolactonase [Sphingobacterium kitahiroshimense]NJI73370.1 amidohydrolase family protein [Sphingobacterium sp. B16(2022)]TCR01646.1 L-fuconolactonase [Sphingobacterium sp. JUb78]